jgi:hypothetical protein
LTEYLAAEINNHLNAIFRGDLDAMLRDCRARLQVLMQNDFLVMSSLLDPRYVLQIEALTSKSLQDYRQNFMEMLDVFRAQDYEINNDPASAEDLSSSSDAISGQTFDFWKLLKTAGSSNDVLPSPTRELENQVEVNFNPGPTIN